MHPHGPLTPEAVMALSRMEDEPWALTSKDIVALQKYHWPSARRATEALIGALQLNLKAYVAPTRPSPVVRVRR
jgi:hypothetical protein